MLRPGFAVALLAFLFCSQGPFLYGQAERYNGQRIANVYLYPVDQPLSRDQIGISIGLRRGDTFDERQLSDAIQRLYSTGRYRDIAVEVEPGPNGIILTFNTKPAYFVSSVQVMGVPEPPNPAILNKSTGLDLGTEFDEKTDLATAQEGLEKVLRDNGFYNVKIQPHIERKESTQEVFIRFTVDPGDRAKFAAPLFQGNLQRSESSLIRATNWQRWWGLRGWKELSAQRVQSGVERLRGVYLKKNFLLAEVHLTGLNYDATKNTVQPVVSIDAGPKVAVRTSGAKVSKGLLRELIPIYQERTIDRELLIEGQNHLIEHFQSKGFFDAKVTFSQTDTGDSGSQEIRYSIDRGPRYRMKHVEIVGNHYFNHETISERLSVIPARFPQYRRGRFSPSLMSRDVDAILDLYRTNGFRDAKVTPNVEGSYNGKERDLAVTYTIEEGAQWFVGSLDVSGVDLRLLDEVQSQISSNGGQPFSITTVANDRDTILNYYFNNGYPDATFDAQLVPSDQPNRINLKYVVSEGRRNFVRDVLVNGLDKTRPDLVYSRLSVAPLQPLSQGRIVDSQRRLYDLGIFAKVDVGVQNPQGKERNKYVLMNVEEAKKYSLNLGLGAEFGRIGGGSNSFDAPAGANGFSPRALVSISRTNFLGLAHTASATFRISSYQRRALLNYLAPQFRGNENVSLTFSGLFDRSRDIRTFTSNRLEGAVQINQRLNRADTIQYRVILRNVTIDTSTLKIDPSLIPVYSRPVKVAVLSGSFIQDKRDDPLDATRGTFNTIDFGYAPQVFKSTSYTRLSARNSSYHRVSKNLVLARSLSVGWLNNLANEPVPLPERYFAGGATTHRGFPENQAGPRDPVTGFPIGGDANLFINTELRFPLIGTNVGGVFFHDAGNVYSSFSDISFRFRQKDRSDFDYMVHSFGFGIRLRTPVGPVRLDLGYSPNSPRFVGFQGTQDELINGTGRYNVPQRVNPFQFHFSIGQAF